MEASNITLGQRVRSLSGGATYKKDQVFTVKGLVLGFYGAIFVKCENGSPDNFLYFRFCEIKLVSEPAVEESPKAAA